VKKRGQGYNGSGASAFFGDEIYKFTMKSMKHMKKNFMVKSFFI
jgi:hypothetical protein